MKLIIDGAPNEIADLVLAVQGRQPIRAVTIKQPGLADQLAAEHALRSIFKDLEAGK